MLLQGGGHFRRLCTCVRALPARGRFAMRRANRSHHHPAVARHSRAVRTTCSPAKRIDGARIPCSSNCLLVASVMADAAIGV